MTEPCSPCNNICSIDPRDGLCSGCLRTLEEIAAWPRLSAAEKRALLARLDVRRAAYIASGRGQPPN
jgi:uncharacterized protein